MEEPTPTVMRAGSSTTSPVAASLTGNLGRIVPFQSYSPDPKREMTMSHIPNSAMPHAAPSEKKAPPEQAKSGLAGRTAKVAELARGNPKTAIAAGAVVVAGLAAAAAIPLVLGRKSGSDTASSAKSKKAKQSA
jgi:hypothetical protein